jgi:cell division protein FtsI (penicillin-binding protein 3)
VNGQARKNRNRFVLVVCFLGFVVVLLRALWLQVVPDEKLNVLAQRQFKSKVQVQSRRSPIVDRNGMPLVVSVKTYSFFMDPKRIAQPRRFARRVAKMLGIEARTIEQKIAQYKQKRFVWLVRHMPEEKAKRILTKKTEGLYSIQEYKRFNTKARLASHLLGFTSIDGRGLEGIERSFNSRLDQDPRILTIEKDARGRVVYRQMSQISAHGGKRAGALKLSLDAALQFQAEKLLGQTIEKHNAKGGTAIVMDPHTGALLALANYPDFNPLMPGKFPMSFRRNRAVTDPIEPGSVLKPFVVTEALDRGLVNENTWIATPGGKVKVADRWINEADKKHERPGYKVKDLIKHSSNVAIVKLMQQVGYPVMRDVYKKLGFGELTGVELPGESRGIVPWPQTKQIVEQATWSFGQGIALTPLQIVSAYASLANGGYRVKPHLLETEGVEKAKGERLFSEQTLQKMRKILEAVVEEEGSGTTARIGHFRVAGKTGTSQKADPNGGYMRGSYIASFVGFFPSTQPRFVIYVAIDEPVGLYYGGQVAGPLFSELARFAMRMPAESDLQQNLATLGGFHFSAR